LRISRKFGLGADAGALSGVLGCLIRTGDLKGAAELWSEVVEISADVVEAEEGQEDGVKKEDQPGLWAEASLGRDISVLRAWIHAVSEACVPSPEAEPDEMEPEGIAGCRESARRALDAIPVQDRTGADRRAQILLTAFDDPASAMAMALEAIKAARGRKDVAIGGDTVSVPEVWAAIVIGFANQGKLDQAREACDRAGPTEECALAATNALISALAKSGDFSDALKTAAAMRSKKMLLPDEQTVLALLRPFRNAALLTDPDDPPEVAKAGRDAASNVVRVFAALAFDPGFSQMIGQINGRPSEDVPFTPSRIPAGAPPAPKDKGPDMPIDLSSAPWSAPLLLRSVAISTRSADLVDEAHRRLLDLSHIESGDPIPHRTHAEALLLCGAPGRAALRIRASFEEHRVAPEAGRVASVYLKLKEEGRMEEALAIVEFLKGVDGAQAEIEVIEKYFSSNEQAGEKVEDKSDVEEANEIKDR
jgi:pentatricopeptide repeat protein